MTGEIGVAADDVPVVHLAPRFSTLLDSSPE